MDNTNGYCMAHLQIRHRRNTDIKYTTWLIYRYIVIVTNIKLTSWHIYGYIIILTWTSSTQCGSSMGDVINVRQTSNSTPLKIFQGWRGVENVERDVIKSSPSIIFSVYVSMCVNVSAHMRGGQRTPQLQFFGNAISLFFETRVPHWTRTFQGGLAG